MTITPLASTFVLLDNSDVPKAAMRTWMGQVEADIGTGGGGGVNENLLINGDFQINQRNYVNGTSISGATYGLDRWRASAAGAAVMSLTGFVLTLTSGEIEQRVECATWGVTNFASTQVTVSVESPADNLTITWGTTSGTITAGAGRKTVTLTSAAGDNSTSYLTLKIKKASAGSTTLGQVKMEFGAAATAWKPRPRAAELAACQRYFQSYGSAFAAVQLRSYQNSGLYFQTTLLFPVEMRLSPTVVLNGTWGVANCGQPQFDQTTPKTVRVSALVTTLGDAYFYSVDATTFVTFNAEL